MRIIDFYLGRTPDHAGRLITDIWAFDPGQLEYQHDFIQWLFPLEVPSPVNPLAPLLDAPAIDQFHHSPELRLRLLRSLDLMLAFYGFQRQHTNASPRISRTPTFHARADNWLTPGNHNHLRVTRILRCLTLCGLQPEADALLAQLLDLAPSYPKAISPKTLEFWKGAVRP